MRTQRQIAAAVFACLAATAAGCDKEFAKDDPRNPEAPKVSFISPARGAILHGATSVDVAGIVSDDQGVVDRFTINGETVKVNADGTFAKTLPVGEGITLLKAVATDADGNVGRQTQAVLAGPMEPASMVVPEGLIAQIDEPTLGAIGRGAANFVANEDLGAMVAPLNPVIKVGGDVADCLYAHASIGALDVGSAAFTMVPIAGAIEIDVALNGVTVPLTTKHAVACVDGVGALSVTADQIRIKARMTLAAKAGEFDIKLSNQEVTIAGMHIDSNGLAGDILDLLALDTALAKTLEFAAEKFVVPAMNHALAGLNQAKTVDVMGKQLTIRVTPAKIDVDQVGVAIHLDTNFRFAGDAAGEGFVYTANQAPLMGRRGVEFAIADDMLNQLFGSMWGAGVMNQAIDMKAGDYGAAGQLFTKVETKGLLPPMIDADATGGLRIVIGDLVANFTDHGALVTSAAVNGEVLLKVTQASHGELRLDIAKTNFQVDILSNDDGVEGTNALSSDALEALLSFAIERATGLASGAIGTVALPNFGGVTVKNPHGEARGGYVIVGADVE